MIVNSQDHQEFNLKSYISLGLFILYSSFSTYYNFLNLKHIHLIKRRDNYPFDKNDFIYEDNISLIKMIIMCHISGILGGIVGIAGGIILGPLLLSLGMLPMVVASTN